MVVAAASIATASASHAAQAPKEPPAVQRARTGLAAAQARQKAQPSKESELAVDRALLALNTALGTSRTVVHPYATIAEIEPNDTFATATANITPGGDLDFYSFPAPAGSRVWVETDTGGTQNGGATSRDTVIDLLDTDGATVIENDDDDGTGNGADGTIETGLSSLIAGRSITTGGTHFVRVKAFSATAIVDPYAFSVVVTTTAAVPEVEANDTAATANVLFSGAPYVGVRSGAIGVAADVDYYSVTATAGDTIFFVADGDPARTGTGTDLVVEFRDPADALLLSVDSSVTGSVANPAAEGARFTVTSSGTFFVKVRHFSATGTGTYDLMVANLTQTTPVQLQRISAQ
jgi:hypothetical protein